MSNDTDFGPVIKALEETSGRLGTRGVNWLEVILDGYGFTVLAGNGIAFACSSGWREPGKLSCSYSSSGEKHYVHPAEKGNLTCQWLVHRMLGQDFPVPLHLRKPAPRHDAVCRFLRSIDSLPTKSIGGLSFVGTAASMAADALEGRPDDWVNETTREQRVAILYGVLAISLNCELRVENAEVVEALRALEKLEPGPACLTCSQSPEDK